MAGSSAFIGSAGTASMGLLSSTGLGVEIGDGTGVESAIDSPNFCVTGDELVLAESMLFFKHPVTATRSKAGINAEFRTSRTFLKNPIAESPTFWPRDRQVTHKH
jgi:hypothetical protein